MNALVALQLSDLGPPDPETGERTILGRPAVEQLDGFFVVEQKWSLHLVRSVVFGGTTYHLLVGHGPKAGFRALRDAGVKVWGLREAAQLGGAVGAALRKAWPFWLVDGTLTTAEGNSSVSSYPWRFTGDAQPGVDGTMDVSALVRPYLGITTLGYDEDYDGEDAEVD